MAKAGRMPAWIGVLSPRTQTPLRATVLIALIVMVFAVFTPLDTLAETSSEVLLCVFTMINLALVRFKLQGVEAPDDAFTVHIIFPIAGVVCCVGLLIGASLFGT